MNKNDKIFADMQQTLTDYAAITKKAPEKIIVEKGKQLLFGSHNKFGNFKGLYDEFSAKKPRKGKITATSKSLFGANRGVKTSIMSRKTAGDILGGKSAGIFVAGKVKNVASRPRIVRQITKGKRIGQHIVKDLKKSAMIRGNQQMLKKFLVHKDKGEFVLNKQSLAVAIEIAKREHARGYSAAAFLLKRYKKTIEKLAGKEYKNGQLKGVSSVDACVMHKHVKELVNNRHNAISSVEGDVSNKGAWLKITVYTSNVGKAGFNRIVSKVMSSITDDMKNYISKKLKKKY